MTTTNHDAQTEAVEPAAPAAVEPATLDLDAQAQAETTDVTDDTEPAQEATKPGQEAARYRRQLRAAEADRDALRTRLETFQTREVERLATGPGALSLGSDLWRSTPLVDLLDTEGNVDPERVTAAVAGLIQAHFHYGYRPAWPSADAGFRGTGTQPATTTWDSVLRHA